MPIRPTSRIGSPKDVGDPFLYIYIYQTLGSICPSVLEGKHRQRPRETKKVRQREIGQGKAICGCLYFPMRTDHMGKNLVTGN